MLETTEARRNYLVSEPNYHTAKKISDQTVIQKKMLLNKLIFSGLTKLEITKLVMHEFWYD